MPRPAHGERPLYRAGSAKRDLLAFPAKVKDGIGTALSVAQFGGKHPHGGNTYRAVYAVRFRRAVYVLHCFRKKSRRGIQTPKADSELVMQRLRLAERDYKDRHGNIERGT